jgi:hypothetical protein
MLTNEVSILKHIVDESFDGFTNRDTVLATMRWLSALMLTLEFGTVCFTADVLVFHDALLKG